jgi:hypothetical protein
MERLKSVLADKIIEVSSESGDHSKVNLEKLNRFRDFSFACEAFMKKYPGIEDELIRMIQSNDFDTRVASSRVNNIIALIENGGSFQPEAGTNHEMVDSPVQYPEIPSQPDAEADQHVEMEDAGLSNAEPSVTAEAGDIDGVVGGTASNYGSSENMEFEYSSENKVRTNLNRVLIVLAVVAGVLLAYFAIKFVIHNWKIILIVIGVIAALGGLLWILSNKKNNNEIE